MADKIQLEIVTPKGRALSASVDEVTAPSVKGEFGVMPGHLPVLAALRTGIISYKEGGETKRCAVGAGFAEAGPDKLLVLTDDYIVREQIDPVIVRKELADVQAEISRLELAAVGNKDVGADVKGAPETEQLKVLVARENWLAVQLELYGDPPPATTRPFEEFGPPDPPPEDEVPVNDHEGASSSPPAKA